MTNTITKMIISVLLIFIVSCTTIPTEPLLKESTSKTNSIKTFSSLAEIDQFVRQNRISNYGFPEMRSFAVDSIGAPITTSAQMEVAKSSYAPDYSQTNVQVEGVDEADIVKTDGKYLYVLAQNKIFILDAQPVEKTSIISTILFIDERIQEFFINKNRLIVFGTSYKQPKVPQLLENTPTPISEVVPNSVQIFDESISSKMSIARMPIYQENNAFMRVYDLTKPQQPVQEKNIEITGYYTDSRMIDEHVYAVINSGIGYDQILLPRITIDETTKDIDASSISYFDYPEYNYRITNIISLNLNTQEVQQKSYLIGDSGQLYASERNLYITHQQMLQPYDTLQDLLKEVIPVLPTSAVNDIKQIQSIGLSKQDTYQEIMLVLNKHAGNSDPFMSEVVINELKKMLPYNTVKQINNIQYSKLSSDKKTEYISKIINEYLTQLSVEERNAFDANMQEKFSSLLQETQKNQEKVRTALQNAQTRIERRQEQTRIHKISLDKGNILYQASNSVPGRVLNQYSMDEYQDIFRLATTAGWQSSESNVYTLDKNLKRLGNLEGLAPGEQIYSARFMGPKAYLVTFRQVDPLFVIDLSTPTAPRVLGKLKIPGFSNYLHPYDETHLIGIGKDADETGRTKGLKIGLFDVSNVEQPKEVAKYVLPQGSDSEALYEPKAILFSYERNLLVLPVTQYNWGEPIMLNGEKIAPEQFNGVYAFEITPKSIGLKGKISHGTDWNQNIRRSMFIKNALFTISENAVYANSMTDLAKITRVELKTETCGDGSCDASEKECKPCYAEICPMVCLPNPNYCKKDCT